MKQYKLLNNVFGWVAFAIAAIVYILTLEPTTSFWDCPEFITSAYLLEVGHPPGNSFFNLTGRFFANFAGGDVTKVAYMINMMSALCSAATIMFLYWTITHLIRKIECRKSEEMTTGKMIKILGGGMVGAMLYTFTDTFWFSAVEGEVYAFSSMMTAVVFWLILKWESVAHEDHSDRYIILIAYVMGLSVGVHLLNLLCIPAIVLVYYFKKVPNANLKGTMLALLGSGGLILALLYGMIPGFIKLSGYTELFFVNTLGFSYNTGTVFYFFFVLALIIWGMIETWRGTSIKRMRLSFVLSICFIGIPFLGSGYWLGIILSALIAGGVYLSKFNNVKLMNTVLVGLFVLFAGYSTFAQIIIRSVANPPMDQNSPDEIFSYQKYANREQYGDRPLFYGYTFVSDVVRDKNGTVESKIGAPVYTKKVKTSPNEADRYEITGYKENYVYEPELNMLFPRMYSKSGSHVGAYKQWSGFKGRQVTVVNNGETKTVMMPTFGENLKFFFTYQLNYMYWRYFMWNFSGRQNDLQGHGDISRGNWITGFNFLDEFRVGNQDTLPSDMKDNMGRNVYYLMPLILGILGILYQLKGKSKEGEQQFLIVFLLFFMTGIAIVIYLNQTPFQPRERDYAYAGSFYAFSIWIGLGVAWIANQLEALTKNKTLSASLATAVCMLVPVQMAAQNWDDHDRAGRYAARDFGYNYLTSVEENGIIFTNGDNDTFPLWYAQEVEGYRRDVRVCNLSYLQTDWYMDQMKSPAYNSPALPIALKPEQYNGSKLNYAYLFEMTDKPLNLTAGLNWLASEEKRTKTLQGYNERIDYIPSKELVIPIDSAVIAASPVMKSVDLDNLPKDMVINLKDKQVITKNEIALLYMLDGIAKEGWKRPIYYATTVGSDMYMSLAPYFSLTGMAYQVTPVKNGDRGTINTELTYDNMMNKFLWGGVDQKGVYLDETIRRSCYTLRLMFSRLADQLIEEGQLEKANNALEYCMKVLPGYNIPHDYTSISIAQAFLMLGNDEQGVGLATHIADKSVENLDWYFSLKPHLFVTVGQDVRHDLAVLYNIMEILTANEKQEEANAYMEKFELYQRALQ